MFHRIPTVLTAQELIDKAFLRASKITEPRQKTLEEKTRKEVIDRIATIESIITGHLLKIEKKFPSTDRIHPFHRDLFDLMFDLDAYKVSISHLSWAASKIRDISTSHIASVKKAQTRNRMLEIMKAYYGRISSVLHGVDKDLTFLRVCRDSIKRIPDLDPDSPTFILAGMPNVGKSSLLNRLTGNISTVAPYPFTTKNITIGYRDISYSRAQIVDTPGILDRSMDDRNDMERKAILALKDIPGTILFLIDHSETSGYTLAEQEKLFTEIVNSFKKPVIRVQSKYDLSGTCKEEICVSSETGYGMDRLLELMTRMVQDVEQKSAE
ncbi:50S ribosome-binding GTPase [Thermoplasmatales archaeon AK]|nr:50S ribosome-binding GTPase [Thermoplasmatales archaeon AK]